MPYFAASAWKRFTPTRLAARLRAQVGQALARHLAVQQDQVLHVALQLAGAVEAHRRDAQALLEDVGVAAIDEVGMVRQVDRPGDQAAIDEDRFGQHDVGQMRAAAFIGVVADEGVARPDVLGRVAPHDVLDEIEEAAEMDRDVLGLAERLAGGVEQRRRAVAPFLDVGGMRGADQRLAGFVDDRGEGRADDLDGDGVEGVGGFQELPPEHRRPFVVSTGARSADGETVSPR